MGSVVTNRKQQAPRSALYCLKTNVFTHRHTQKSLSSGAGVFGPVRWWSVVKGSMAIAPTGYTETQGGRMVTPGLPGSNPLVLWKAAHHILACACPLAQDRARDLSQFQSSRTHQHIWLRHIWIGWFLLSRRWQ